MSLPHVEVGTDARVAVTLGSLVPEARRKRFLIGMEWKGEGDGASF